MTVDRTEAMLAEITRPGSTRTSIAAVYREGIVANLKLGTDFVDWPSVNAALLQRYTVSGLIYIERLAWRGL